MSKSEEYQKELEKLSKLFADVEESKRQLVEGLIEDAAFLKSENHALRIQIETTGMVKVHPDKPEMQKSMETAKQYLKNINSYSVIIKTLNGVLNNKNDDDEDELSEFA